MFDTAIYTTAGEKTSSGIYWPSLTAAALVRPGTSLQHTNDHRAIALAKPSTTSFILAGQGIKAHNKAQKAKALAKCAAAAATGKSKVQVKKAVMVEKKVELAKVPETIQENNFKDMVEIGAVACEVGMIIAQDEEEVTLSDSKAATQDMVLSASDAISMSAAVYEDVPTGTDININITEELRKSTSYSKLYPNCATNIFAAAESSFVMPDTFIEYDVMLDAHLANLGTPKQFLRRAAVHSCEALDETLHYFSKNDRDAFSGPTRAVDDNGFECIGFRVKNTVQDTLPKSIVLSVDQLFAMFKNKGIETSPISSTAKLTQSLEVVEKVLTPGPFIPSRLLQRRTQPPLRPARAIPPSMKTLPSLLWRRPSRTPISSPAR